MNTLNIYDCNINFNTKKKSYDKAIDDFINACVKAGIDIEINGAELVDENGEEIEE